MTKKSRHFKQSRKPVLEKKVEKLGVRSSVRITKDDGWHVKLKSYLKKLWHESKEE